MRFRRIVGATMAMAGLAAVSGAARAAPGYVNMGLNLRAGPGVDYPLVAQLPPGTQAEIFGCLPGWTWCDIAVDGPDGEARGWAAGVGLQVVYENQPALLPEYGAAVGLPLVGFEIGSYWGHYYRGRPWYGSEDRWRGRPYDRGGPYARSGPPPFGGGFPGRPDDRPHAPPAPPVGHEPGHFAGGPPGGGGRFGPAAPAAAPGGFRSGAPAPVGPERGRAEPRGGEAYGGEARGGEARGGGREAHGGPGDRGPH